MVDLPLRFSTNADAEAQKVAGLRQQVAAVGTATDKVRASEERLQQTRRRGARSEAWLGGPSATINPAARSTMLAASRMGGAAGGMFGGMGSMLGLGAMGGIGAAFSGLALVSRSLTEVFAAMDEKAKTFGEALVSLEKSGRDAVRSFAQGAVGAYEKGGDTAKLGATILGDKGWMELRQTLRRAGVGGDEAALAVAKLPPELRQTAVGAMAEAQRFGLGADAIGKLDPEVLRRTKDAGWRGTEWLISDMLRKEGIDVPGGMLAQRREESGLLRGFAGVDSQLAGSRGARLDSQIYSGRLGSYVAESEIAQPRSEREALAAVERAAGEAHEAQVRAAEAAVEFARQQAMASSGFQRLMWSFKGLWNDLGFGDEREAQHRASQPMPSISGGS